MAINFYQHTKERRIIMRGRKELLHNIERALRKERKFSSDHLKERQYRMPPHSTMMLTMDYCYIKFSLFDFFDRDSVRNSR
jgi:hypothetical protein